MKIKLLLIFLVFLVLNKSYSQVNVTVNIVSLGTTIGDCDGLFLGDSDGFWQYECQDVPDYDGQGFPFTYPTVYTQYHAIDNQNGPYTQAYSEEIFNSSYACLECMPMSLQFGWKACENDGVDLPVGYICDAGTGNITTSVNITDTYTDSNGNGVYDTGEPMVIDANGNGVYDAPGTVTTINATLTGVSGGGCSGNFTINVQIKITGTPVPPVADDICDAISLPIGTTVTKAWCQDQTFETGEPNVPTGGQIDMPNGTAWYYFTAPASGSVQIDTDIPGTSIGTRFVVYHASNGFSCGSIAYCDTSKWSFLSELNGGWADFSVNLPPDLYEADLEMDCGNLLAGFGGLVPGQIYYLQVSADDADVCGSISIRVNNDGGSGAPQYDVPCGAQALVPGTTPISLAAGSSPTTTLDIGCAEDYEIETDLVHAYPYDDAILNNDPTASVWASFVAPSNGMVSVEADCDALASSEFFLIYSPDLCLAPAIPSEYNCVELNFDPSNSAGGDAFFGANSALSVISCLEPGYTYYIMADPSTVSFCGGIDIYTYSPLGGAQPPGNDVLCIAMNNPAYTIPVGAPGSAGTTINGTNTNACHEDLAGEPVLGGAGATVWYNFVAPPSGVVNMNIIPGTINNLGYAIYPSNPSSATGCYGGLDGATGSTYTTTPTTDVTIEALYSSNTNSPVDVDFCCLIPGQEYLIQIDGNSPTSQGTFSLALTEVDPEPGNALVDNVSNFICFDDYVFITSDGEVVPDCMTHGIVIHGEGPTPTANDILTGTVYAVTPISASAASFVNDGMSTTIPFNTIVHASAIVDGNAAAGFDFSTLCPSMQVSTGAPFVFLQPIVITPGAVSLCDASFSVTGGLPAYDPIYGYTYSVTTASGDLVTNGTGLAQSTPINFTGLGPGNYTITVSDTTTRSGGRCDYSIVITIGPDCVCFMDLSTAPTALQVAANSDCITGCIQACGTWYLEANPCPFGSSLQSFPDATTTTGGTPMTTAPTYNQSTTETYHVRCVCDGDATYISPVTSVTSAPVACPVVTAPVGITITNSDCTSGTLANGSFNGFTGACPAGTTLTFYNDALGTDGATILAPTYNQAGPAQTIYCACVDAAGCKSPVTSVGPTVPAICPPGCNSTIGTFPNGN